MPEIKINEIVKDRYEVTYFVSGFIRLEGVDYLRLIEIYASGDVSDVEIRLKPSAVNTTGGFLEKTFLKIGREYVINDVDSILCGLSGVLEYFENGHAWVKCSGFPLQKVESSKLKVN